MRLLRWSNNAEFSLTEDLADDEAIPPYAILSHTWLEDTQEPTFEDLTNDNLQYFWVNICCINKSNLAELSHAINSMFRWYRNAARCYVYLWFTRGWTLQELLAPRSVEFFSRERMRLGNSSSLRQRIQQITGVPASALKGARLSEFSVEERFLWIERRQIKVVEDKVYFLLGILDVKIPLYYGEEAVNISKRV
ncbi:hypothetical protein AOQ84DRAFT_434954 [Glonium stellatum]|uniref:Heterokaryon incompatibility domain-containing protein n=1 Tax=Glonium stellatum TaxID=574774 RepID=A0A8E2EM72_9PEZI|nr:hypothetical protein AOQ84DRAFT_434954 [Glonium stellatum]